jgi:hypothetical protein
LFLLALIASHSAMCATPNPGEPLFCQPDEGATFLIVNGTTGVFTTNNDCYTGSNVNNNNVTVQPTHGTLTSDGAGNYVYVTTDPNFTGLDTFSVHVDASVGYTSGGPGDFGGGAGTIPMTFNVLPSSLPAVTTPFATAVGIPLPAGSVTPCPATYGCVTGGSVGSIAPAHGTLVFSGLTATYTPAAGYSGTDTFTIRARGVNHDGTGALNSGNISVSVTVGAPAVSSVPALGTWGMIALAGLLVLAGCTWTRTRVA